MEQYKGLLQSELLQEGELTHKIDQQTAVMLAVYVFAAMFMAIVLGVAVGKRI